MVQGGLATACQWTVAAAMYWPWHLAAGWWASSPHAQVALAAGAMGVALPLVLRLLALGLLLGFAVLTPVWAALDALLPEDRSARPIPPG
jgi:hypothetical protein